MVIRRPAAARIRLGCAEQLRHEVVILVDQKGGGLGCVEILRVVFRSQAEANVVVIEYVQVKVVFAGETQLRVVRVRRIVRAVEGRRTERIQVEVLVVVLEVGRLVEV